MDLICFLAELLMQLAHILAHLACPIEVACKELVHDGFFGQQTKLILFLALLSTHHLRCGLFHQSVEVGKNDSCSQ